MGRHRKLAIIIPAYNEQNCIKDICIKASKFGDTIVINDCSTDRTETISKSVAHHTVSTPYNLGYGGTVLHGLKLAKEMGYEYVVTIDGDGQHNPKDIGKAYLGLKQGSSMAIGSRNQMGRSSEYLISAVYKKLFKIRDPLSGLKGFKLPDLNLEMLSNSEFYMGLTVLNHCLIEKKDIFQFKIKISKRTSGASRVGGFIIGNLKVLNCLKSLKMFKQYRFNF